MIMMLESVGRFRTVLKSMVVNSFFSKAFVACKSRCYLKDPNIDSRMPKTAFMALFHAPFSPYVVSIL